MYFTNDAYPNLRSEVNIIHNGDPFSIISNVQSSNAYAILLLLLYARIGRGLGIKIRFGRPRHQLA